MRYHGLLLRLVVGLLVVPAFARGDELLVKVEQPPPDGLVVAHVNLTAAAQAPVTKWWNRRQYGPRPALPSKTCLSKWSPMPITTHRRSRGRLPRPASAGGQRRPCPAPLCPWRGQGGALERQGGDVGARSLTHDARRQGGFPSQIAFTDGKVFDSLRWGDRLYHRQLGGFSLAGDPQAKTTLVSRGPLCTAVRVTGRTSRPAARRPPSAPQAVYDWLYLADRPLLLVRAAITQRETLRHGRKSTSWN